MCTAKSADHAQVLVDGKRVLLERRRVTVTLSQLEDEVLAALCFLFNQVERPRVATRDFAALGENEVQQAVGIAFGRKRRADSG